MSALPSPIPLIDSLQYLAARPAISPTTPDFIQTCLPAMIDFLQQYDGSQATFNAYRKELERLLQWCWHVAQKSLFSLTRADLIEYIQFCLAPPTEWISTWHQNRFINKDGKRIANSQWRPFVVTVSKAEHQQGIAPDKKKYQLSPKAIREIFTVLSSFYQYLILEKKVSTNPIALIRQKSKYLKKRQTAKPIPKLTPLQWSYSIEAADTLAKEDPTKHERTLFMMSALYLMYLRISELVASSRWEPKMGDFYQDTHGNWWFKTIGKGNKERDITVCPDMLSALKRYRKARDLFPELPIPGEENPLIHKLRGHGNLASDRKARDIIQSCFNRAVDQLTKDSFNQEAQTLMLATVHWLRHTGISDDINHRGRPIAHVRDDAGHSSSAITDRYNDIDLQARHYSARHKKINPD